MTNDERLDKILNRMGYSEGPWHTEGTTVSQSSFGGRVVCTANRYFGKADALIIAQSRELMKNQIEVVIGLLGFEEGSGIGDYFRCKPDLIATLNAACPEGWDFDRIRKELEEMV